MAADVLGQLRLIVSSIDEVYLRAEHFLESVSGEKLISYIEHTGDISVLELIGRSDSRRLHSFASYILDEIKVDKNIFAFMRSSYIAGYGLSILSYLRAFPKYASKPEGDLTILVKLLVGSDPVTRAYAINALTQCLVLKTIEVDEINTAANIIAKGNLPVAGIVSNLGIALRVAVAEASHQGISENLDTFVGSDAITLHLLKGFQSEP